MVSTKEQFTHSGMVFCSKCGEPCTWFNYRNIYEGGKVVGRDHNNCNAPDILNYKHRREEANNG